MRDDVDATGVHTFMRELAAESGAEGRVYITGGASSVLLGWRMTTLDIDLEIIPDTDKVLRAIPAIKERLQVNVELASPADFIPELPGWEERSLFITREKKLNFHHYDFYAQCLAKIERRHRKDHADIASMFANHLVEKARLMELFERIEPQLYRYPAINPAGFRRAVETTMASA